MVFNIFQNENVIGVKGKKLLFSSSSIKFLVDFLFFSSYKIRFFWIIAFALSVWLCGASIQTVWIKWQTNPVTMSLTEKEMPVSAIPFPTVTICPETKTYAKKINVTDAYHSLLEESRNLTETEYETFLLKIDIS